MKYAALFGGSKNDKNSKEYIQTLEIGKYLAELGYTVKNGGYGGMMEAVSKGVVQNGGKSIGVTCSQVSFEIGNEYLSEVIATDKLYDRLKILIEETSIFIVQKGGIGTLAEAFLVLDIMRKERRNLPPNVFFVGNVWNLFIQELKDKFISKSEHQLFKICVTLEELKESINLINK